MNQGLAPFEAKIADPIAFARRAATLPRPLVFTNGVFDILHRGHATYLARARALGACLLVALNGDASVRRLGKGPGRPVNALEDRLALVAALQAVDAVTWFEETAGVGSFVTSRAFSADPTTPTLNAATLVSASRRLACRRTRSAASVSRCSTPLVSCTVSAVTTESGWQPRAASVSKSACRPAPPVGSEAAKVRTIGGDFAMG